MPRRRLGFPQGAEEPQVAVGPAVPSCREHLGGCRGPHALSACSWVQLLRDLVIQDLVCDNLVEISLILSGHLSTAGCKALFLFFPLHWKQLSFSTEDFSGKEKRKKHTTPTDLNWLKHLTDLCCICKFQGKKTQQSSEETSKRSNTVGLE